MRIAMRIAISIVLDPALSISVDIAGAVAHEPPASAPHAIIDHPGYGCDRLCDGRICHGRSVTAAIWSYARKKVALTLGEGLGDPAAFLPGRRTRTEVKLMARRRTKSDRG